MDNKFATKIKIYLQLTFTLILWLTGTLHSQPSLNLFENTWYGFNEGTFNEGRYPASVKLPDVDNDGDLDVVVARYTWNTGFALLLNNGDGFFSEPIHYPSMKQSHDLDIGDFNNDGFIDVIVPNTGFLITDSTLSLFYNNGNGTFASPVQLPVGTGPAGTKAIDLNNDGYLDIVCANYGRIGLGTTISVIFNNGDGTFTPQQVFPAGDSPFKVQAGDINGDNFADIIVANDYSKLNILINQNGNDFINMTELSLSGTVYATDIFPTVALADPDKDNDLDIFYSSTRTWNTGAGMVRLLRNTGAGTFSAPEDILLTNFTAGAVDVKLDDINGDTWLDIISASYSGRTSDGYHVLLNDGTGHYPSVYRNPAGQATFNLATGDIDNDGDVDIVSADNYSLDITVHKNFGGGYFPTPDLYPTTAGSRFLDAADIDLDGDLDVITSASIAGATGVPVAVLKNNGDGSFGNFELHTIRDGGVQAKFRDLNGDGYADIVFATSRTAPPYDFHTAMNNGDGSFGPVQTWPQNSCGWADIDAMDLDNDNDLDVVVTEWLGCPNVPFSGRRIYINRNNGNGTFQPPLIKIVNPHPAAIAYGDFNGDGNLDLATSQSYTIDIHLGTGTGDILPPVEYSVGQGPFDVFAADLNKDGILDLASCNNGDIESMSVLIGVGDGTFLPQQNYAGAYSPDLGNSFGITAGDINGDTWPDLIVSNPASNQFSVYLNNEDGTFDYDIRVGVYYGAAGPFYGDFNNDGIPDIASTVGLPPSGVGSAVVVMKGRYSVVPVELEAFTAAYNNNGVELKWSTATETNNSHFVIEKSFDKKTFTSIGRVEGKGTTTETHHYSFIDSNVKTGTVFYRLKQFDYDGTFSTSDVVNVSVPAPDNYELSQNYPNPFNPSTNIRYSLPKSGFVSIKIFNVIGKEVGSLINKEQQTGNYEVAFDASELASGVYYYKIQAGDFTQTKKMLLVK